MGNGTDLLIAQEANQPNPFPDLLAEQVKLLRKIVNSVDRPKIALSVDLRFNGAQQSLNGGADICEARFSYQRKPVKSYYTIVSVPLDCPGPLAVAINHPIVKGANLADSNGIQLPRVSDTAGQNWLVLPDLEVEYLQISFCTGGAGVVGVNNSVQTTPAGGTIMIYAWGIPAQDMMETQ